MISEVLELVHKKWFYGRGREEEAIDMFNLFDRKEKGLIGLAEIKQVFNQYLDIIISDNDIQEFIQDADTDKDGYLHQQDFFAKLGYQWLFNNPIIENHSPFLGDDWISAYISSFFL